MGNSIFALLASFVLVGAAALMVIAVRRAGSVREELTDRAASRGWGYTRSRSARKGDYAVCGTSPAGLDWTITSFSIESDSRRSRIEFRMPALSSAADFAIGPAKEVAMLVQLTAFTEQHERAGSLIRRLGTKAGGPLALVSGGVVEPIGSGEFRRAFGAVRTSNAAMPVRLSPELEKLFLSWPEALDDPGNVVTAWRDPNGLHVSVIAPAGPSWAVIEQLAALGEMLSTSVRPG
jgi:hypothetical protein